MLSLSTDFACFRYFWGLVLDEILWPSVCTHLVIFSKVAGGFFCTVMAGGEIPIITGTSVSFVRDTRSHKEGECSVRSSTCSLSFQQAVN